MYFLISMSWCISLPDAWWRIYPLRVIQNSKKLSSKLRQKDASTSKNWPNHSNLFNSKLKTASTLPIFVSSPEKMIYVGWQGDTHPALFSFHFLPPTFLKWWIRTICHLRSQRWEQPRNEFKSCIFMIVSLLILQDYLGWLKYSKIILALLIIFCIAEFILETLNNKLLTKSLNCCIAINWLWLSNIFPSHVEIQGAG